MESYSSHSRFSIDKVCEVALAPTNKTMIGASFPLLIVMLLMNWWKFSFFLLRAYLANLLLRYRNLINHMVSFTLGFSVGEVVCVEYDTE